MDLSLSLLFNSGTKARLEKQKMGLQKFTIGYIYKPKHNVILQCQTKELILDKVLRGKWRDFYSCKFPEIFHLRQGSDASGVHCKWIHVLSQT